LNRTI